jgi:RNA polymerase sigma factor (sigma-70 family)
MQTTNADSRRTSARVVNDDEAALMRRIACQERHAFELLYRIYYRRLMRFLDRLTRRPQMIEEILDDTMLVVWRKAATFNGASQVSTWIFAIAYRKAMKVLKRERSRTQVLPDHEEPAFASNPETDFIYCETRGAVRHLVAGLSAEQRAVVELTYYHGYAYREIAEIVGCPVNTVKTRMFHARRKLRAVLAALEEESGDDAIVSFR